MNDIVEDYLRAVGALLPEAQRADIVAELRDLILTRLEDLAESLGRPAGLAEVETVLREVGHPLVVAARYREGPQAAVGPALYPYWVFVVKAGLALEAVITLMVFLVRAVATGDVAEAFARAAGAGLGGAATLIGCITVIALLIERRGLRVDYLDRWRVKDLRVIEVLAGAVPALRSGGVSLARRARAAGGGMGRTRRAFFLAPPRPSEFLGAAAGEIVFLLWWTGALQIRLFDNLGELRGLGLDPSALLTLDGALLQREAFWPVLALVSASLLGRVTSLVWPDKTVLRGAFDVAVGAGLASLVLFLLTLSPLAGPLHADSLAGLGLRVRGAVHDGAPVPLDLILALFLFALLLAGCLKILEGLVRLVLALRSARPPHPETASAA